MHAIALLMLAAAMPAGGLVESFRTLEQSLMSAVAPGDKAPWERATDPSCVFTTEEGRVTRLVNFRKFQPLVWTRVD